MSLKKRSRELRAHRVAGNRSRLALGRCIGAGVDLAEDVGQCGRRREVPDARGPLVTTVAVGTACVFEKGRASLYSFVRDASAHLAVGQRTVGLRTATLTHSFKAESAFTGTLLPGRVTVISLRVRPLTGPFAFTKATI